MAEQLQLESGNIRIADDVVAKLPEWLQWKHPELPQCLEDCQRAGQKRLSGKNVQKGVSVEVGQLEAAIDLRIIVLYETPIHEVSRMLQQNVREAVETMTGLRVVEVNVKVEGVSFKGDDL
ncbi:Asp23/Gls24 family envelope stress response protein [Paenibacillus amylolyticus]|nr:Asp23/Gls24 family envelope stress response protein [Paenibacillus amylolyticus]